MEYVTRTGKVFQIGDYPDKNFTLSHDEALSAITLFQPVPANLEHRSTPIDGILGGIQRVWKEGNAIYGESRIPKWFDDHLKENDKPLQPSLEWNRGTKQIAGVAWVNFPRIEDAAMMSVFSTKVKIDPNLFWDDKICFDDKRSKYSLDEEQRNKIDADDFAGPDRSFPIDTPEHLESATRLYGKADNPDAVKSKIIAIAKKKGWTKHLPDDWTSADMSDMNSVHVDKSMGEENNSGSGLSWKNRSGAFGVDRNKQTALTPHGQYEIIVNRKGGPTPRKTYALSYAPKGRTEGNVDLGTHTALKTAYDIAGDHHDEMMGESGSANMSDDSKMGKAYDDYWNHLDNGISSSEALKKIRRKHGDIAADTIAQGEKEDEEDSGMEQNISNAFDDYDGHIKSGHTPGEALSKIKQKYSGQMAQHIAEQNDIPVFSRANMSDDPYDQNGLLDNISQDDDPDNDLDDTQAMGPNWRDAHSGPLKWHNWNYSDGTPSGANAISNYGDYHIGVDRPEDGGKVSLEYRPAGLLLNKPGVDMFDHDSVDVAKKVAMEHHKNTSMEQFAKFDSDDLHSLSMYMDRSDPDDVQPDLEDIVHRHGLETGDVIKLDRSGNGDHRIKLYGTKEALVNMLNHKDFMAPELAKNIRKVKQNRDMPAHMSAKFDDEDPDDEDPITVGGVDGLQHDDNRFMKVNHRGQTRLIMKNELEAEPDSKSVGTWYHDKNSGGYRRGMNIPKEEIEPFSVNEVLVGKFQNNMVMI